MTRAARASLVCALIAAHLLLSVLAMRRESPMTDEGGHYSYGRRILEGNTRFLEGPYGFGKVPFSALNALPWALAERLGAEKPLIRLATANRSPAPSSISVPPEQVFPVLTGRLATLPFSALLALLVYAWSRRLYGPAGGLASLFLYAFCPNLLAHSHLVMVDLYAALMVAAASFTFWLFLRRGGWRWATASALVLALAQLAKYTCLLLYPVFLLVAAIESWPRWIECARSRDPRLWRRRMGRAGVGIAFYLGVLLVVLNVGYLGQETFKPLSEYRFQSADFRALQAKVLRVADPPLPVPSAPVIGLDALRYHERVGKAFPNLYLLGELRLSNQPDLEGFKSYYLVAWLFKVPIASQLLLLAALASHASRRGREYFSAKELALVAPILFYALHFSFLYKAQIGIRHFLVVFPLVFVLCGAAARPWWLRRRAARFAAVALGLYLVASVLSYYPHFLAYFNELVWDRKQAYKILADSNLDMQGNQWLLEEYLAAHPEVTFSPSYIDRPGTILVDVNRFVGELHATQYLWLRKNFEPVGHVGHSYLLFEIGPEDMHLVPRPSTLRQMAAWIDDNLPHGASILRENATPSPDPAHFPTARRPLLGRVPPRFVTSGRWDFVLLASASYDRFLADGAEADAAVAARYEEMLAWPVVAAFDPAPGQEGSRLSLHRIDGGEVEHRERRRWSAADAAWVSDEAIRPASGSGPLTFTARWQAAAFKEHLEAGRYEVRLFTHPARPEAYVDVATLDGEERGPFAAGRGAVVDLPRRDKYLLRVYVEPGASLSAVLIRPASPDSALSPPIERDPG